MARLHCISSIALLSWQVLAQTVASNPPLSATIQVERVVRLVDGNSLTKVTTGRYYRDDQHRTRTEVDNRVMIFDPVAKKAITLDNKMRTAKVVNLQNRPDHRSAAVSGGEKWPDPAPLGTDTVEGYAVTGKEYVSTIPIRSELGNAKPIRRVTRLWYSDELMLPLLTRAEDPLSGNTTMRYQNLKVGTNPSVDLFLVPPGFSIIEETDWQPNPPPGVSGVKRAVNPAQP
jgi:hypothetical protein